MKTVSVFNVFTRHASVAMFGRDWVYLGSKVPGSVESHANQTWFIWRVKVLPVVRIDVSVF